MATVSVASSNCGPSLAPALDKERAEELLIDLTLRADGSEANDNAQDPTLRDVARDSLRRFASPGDELIDVDEMLAKFEAYRDDHVVHDTLNGHHMIQAPFLLKLASGPDALKTVVRFGRGTRGHPRLVHGGVVAMVFDNLFGWATFLTGQTNVLTAFIKVDYVKPLQTDSLVLVTVSMAPPEGRKLYLHGKMTSLDGKTTYQTATSLFVIPRSATGVADAAAAAAGEGASGSTKTKADKTAGKEG